MEQLGDELLKHVALPREVEHFQGLQMVEQVELSIHHMQHTLIDNFELLLNRVDKTLLYG